MSIDFHLSGQQQCQGRAIWIEESEQGKRLIPSPGPSRWFKSALPPPSSSVIRVGWDLSTLGIKCVTEWLVDLASLGILRWIPGIPITLSSLLKPWVELASTSRSLLEVRSTGCLNQRVDLTSTRGSQGRGQAYLWLQITHPQMFSTLGMPLSHSCFLMKNKAPGVFPFFLFKIKTQGVFDYLCFILSCSTYSVSCISLASF